jgi:hypothetical protein
MIYENKPGLALDLGTTSAPALVIRNCPGFVLKGGFFASPNKRVAISVQNCAGGRISGVRLQSDGTFDGLEISGSSDIAVSGSTIFGARVNMRVEGSQHVSVVGNTLVGMRIDGVRIISSQWVDVLDNAFAGTNVLGEAHADAVQIWTEDGKPRAADITVARNLIHGDTMGINCYGKPGGADRVKVFANTLAILRSNGINLQDCPGSEIHDNVLRALPGSQGGVAIRTEGPGITVGTNIIEK